MRMTPWFVRIPGLWCVLSLCGLVLWLVAVAFAQVRHFHPEVSAGLMISTVVSFGAWVFGRILWVVIGDAFTRGGRIKH